MKLTAKGRYAVTAMADIAAQDGAVVPLSAIAVRQGINLPVLEQVMGKLRRAGLVESVRGSAGGYLLAVPADDVSVEAVIAAIDIDIRAQGCRPGDRLSCTGASTRCLTHDLWSALEDNIAAFLAGVSIADIVAGRVRAGEIA